jgi:hypothetical protein
MQVATHRSVHISYSTAAMVAHPSRSARRLLFKVEVRVLAAELETSRSEETPEGMPHAPVVSSLRRALAVLARSAVRAVVTRRSPQAAQPVVPRRATLALAVVVLTTSERRVRGLEAMVARASWSSNSTDDPPTMPAENEHLAKAIGELNQSIQQLRSELVRKDVYLEARDADRRRLTRLEDQKVDRTEVTGIVEDLNEIKGTLKFVSRTMWVSLVFPLFVMVVGAVLLGRMTWLRDGSP